MRDEIRINVVSPLRADQLILHDNKPSVNMVVNLLQTDVKRKFNGISNLNGAKEVLKKGFI